MPSTRFRRRTRRNGIRWAAGLAAVAAAVLALALHGGSRDTTAGAGGTARAGLTVWAQPKPLPEVRFIDGDGRPRSLDDFKGKVVLLNLWATWCGPCREEMPTLERLQGLLGGADFEVVALSVDQGGPQPVREFYRQLGVKRLALYNDPSAQAAITLEAIGLPSTLVLDRQGREIGRKLGTAEWDSPEIVEYLRELMKSDVRQHRA